MLCYVSANTSNNVTLENGGLKAVISNDESANFGSLVALTKGDAASVLTQSSQALWTATFAVVGSPPVTMTPSTLTAKVRTVVQQTGSAATFQWQGIQIGTLQSTFNATLSLNVTSSGLLEMKLDVSQPIGKDAAALWQYSLLVSHVSLSNASSLLENSGFGVAHRCGSPSVVDDALACSGWSNAYPQATFQFMGAWEETSVKDRMPAFYFGAHDPDGNSKNFAAVVDPRGTVEFSVTQTVENAGVCDEGYIRDTGALRTSPNQGARTSSYAVVLGVLASGDWWDLSQIYRTWALTRATWTRKGPLKRRNDVPRWLLNVTTWINSHWQGRDIFNLTGKRHPKPQAPQNLTHA